jgi:hypothetical protein
MKNNYKSSIRIGIKSLLLVLALSVGCTDLNETPDSLGPDGLVRTAEELKFRVNGIYDDLTMGSGDWNNIFYNRYVFECLIGYQVGWEKQPLQYNLGNVSSQDDVIEAYWGQCYRSIYRANTILETVGKVDDPANAALLSRLKGEAQFLRAFYYYGLLSYFDNVPVTTTAPAQVSADLPSNTGGKRAVLDLIIADCKAAAAILPKTYTGADVGRATQWAAKTLLMKAQLWDEQWGEARKTAEDIIANSGMTLYTDFSFNFDVGHENAGERIFEGQVSAQANANEYSNHSAHFNPEDLPTEMGGAGWSWLSATKDFRMSYDDLDKRIEGTFVESYPTARTKKNTAGQFPTVHWSKDAPYGIDREGGLVDKNADPNNPAQLIFSKAWSAKITEIMPGKAYTNTEKNTIYFRYSDVLLGHAEACNESATGDAYAGINLVRQRAGLSDLSGLSQRGLRDAIVQERLHEFAFEQVLYPELRRKSTFGSTQDYLGDYIKHFVQTYQIKREVKARDYVLPIPLKEILGNPNVGQNEVWK